MDIGHNFYVPAAAEAAAKILRFSHQTIGDFVKERLKHPPEGQQSGEEPRPPHFLPPQDYDAREYAEIMMFTSQSCLHGYRGEKLIDLNDPAYSRADTPRAKKDTLEIVTNGRCADPCILDGTALAHCELDPAPLEKLIFAVLVEALRVSPEHNELKQPGRFAVGCDAYVRSSMEWVPVRLLSFSQPKPVDTFDVAKRWALHTLWRNTEHRIEMFPTFSARSYNFRRRTVLCRKDIVAKFACICRRDLTIEQVIYVIDSIIEEYFVTDRDHGCKTHDGRSQNVVRIQEEAWPDPPATYESDGETVVEPR